MFELFGALLALVFLVIIAFPSLITAPIKGARKPVGSTYWGAYDGAPLEDGQNEGRVEVPKPARKVNIIAGSAMYAGGNGIGRR